MEWLRENAGPQPAEKVGPSRKRPSRPSKYGLFFIGRSKAASARTYSAQRPRRAASASSARSCMKAKNPADWPRKRPMSVKNLTTPLAIFSVSVGRITEHGGRSGLMKGHGSGMIRFALRSSLAEVRSGKLTDTAVTGSTAVNLGALPALSCQVWKCMVSVGPILIRIRRTSGCVARCAMAG